MSQAFLVFRPGNGAQARKWAAGAFCESDGQVVVARWVRSVDKADSR